jgi:hypothetical protein
VYKRWTSILRNESIKLHDLEEKYQLLEADCVVPSTRKWPAGAQRRAEPQISTARMCTRQLQARSRKLQERLSIDQKKELSGKNKTHRSISDTKESTLYTD